MRIIFIVLFLVSFGSVSMGGVGDVYFCETIKSVAVDKKKKFLRYETSRFKFKITTIALPAIGIGLPLIFFKNNKKKKCRRNICWFWTFVFRIKIFKRICS